MWERAAAAQQQPAPVEQKPAVPDETTAAQLAERYVVWQQRMDAAIMKDPNAPFAAMPEGAEICLLVGQVRTTVSTLCLTNCTAQAFLHLVCVYALLLQCSRGMPRISAWHSLLWCLQVAELVGGGANRDENAVNIAKKVYAKLYQLTNSRLHVTAYVAALEALQTLTKRIVVELTAYFVNLEDERKFDRIVGEYLQRVVPKARGYTRTLRVCMHMNKACT